MANASMPPEVGAYFDALGAEKSCLRFRGLADVDLEAVAEAVAAFPVERFLATYERIRG